MAYPMVRMMRFAEFRERLVTEFGCLVESMDRRVDGELLTFRYFKRVVNGREYYCAFSDGEDTMMTPHVLRSYCTRLKIMPEVFGLHLG